MKLESGTVFSKQYLLTSSRRAMVAAQPNAATAISGRAALLTSSPVFLNVWAVDEAHLCDELAEDIMRRVAVRMAVLVSIMTV